MDSNHETTDPGCASPATNGAAGSSWVKPPPPPELAGRVFEPVPPEVAEHFRRTFDERAFWAEAEEALRTGGVPFEDIIANIERKLHGGT